MKKTRLIVDYEYEFDLAGLISSVKFYKLAWAINQKLDIRLVKQADYELLMKNNKAVRFINYIYESDNCTLQLFKNKSDTKEVAYLIPEMNHLDYVLKVDSVSQSFANEEVVKALRDVKWIEYIATIDVDNLKSKDNFLS